jgi:hypothetical protein
MKGISLSFIVKVLVIIISILIFSYGVYSLYNVTKTNNNNVTFLSKKIDSLVIETIILNNLNKKYDSLNIETIKNKERIQKLIFTKPVIKTYDTIDSLVYNINLKLYE